jgi:hypothetical protein
MPFRLRGSGNILEELNYLIFLEPDVERIERKLAGKMIYVTKMSHDVNK